MSAETRKRTWLPYGYRFQLSIRPSLDGTCSLVVPHYLKAFRVHVISNFPMQVRLYRSGKRVFLARSIGDFELTRRIHLKPGTVLRLKAVNSSEGTRKWNRVRVTVMGLARLK